MIKTLSIDLETYSDVDIAKCGVYKYAASPNFEILLFGYSIDGGEVQVVDLAQGEKIPEVILEMIADDDVLKTAFNAVFERVCLSTYLHRFHPELISLFMALHNGLGCILWLPSFPEGSRCCNGPGKAKTGRRKGTDTLLLCPMQTDQIQWRQDQKSS